VKYSHLTWPEVGGALSNWLVLPLGSIEQHGPHLPLCVDEVLAETLADEVAERVGGFVAPTFAYGARSLPNSGGGPRYPGTVHLSGEVLLKAYQEIISSFIRGGARRLLVLNGHWENEGLIFEAIDACRENGRLAESTVIALSWWAVVHERDMVEIFGSFPGWHAEHAGQAETALMLAYNDQLVHMDRAVDHHDSVPAGIYAHPSPEGWSGNDGVLARTTHATSEQGRLLRALVVDRLVALLRTTA
jgi:creatinine amidohydrolase